MGRVTLKDVAQRVGCSTSLVSYVLRGDLGEQVRCSKSRIAEIIQVARDLDYPYINGRNSSSKVVGIIGLALLKTPGAVKMIEIFSEAFEYHDYSLKLFEASRAGYESLVEKQLKRGELHAIICLHFPYWKCVEYAREAKIPYLIVNAGSVEDSNCVYLDDESGIVQLVRYLKDSGYGRIAYISPFSGYSHISGKIRNETTKRECANADIEIAASIDETKLTPEFIKYCVSQNIKVIINSYFREGAGEVFKIIEKAGCQNDIRLINIGILSDDPLTSKLTRVDLPFGNLARSSVDRLLRMLAIGEITCSNEKIPEYISIGEI